MTNIVSMLVSTPIHPNSRQNVELILHILGVCCITSNLFCSCNLDLRNHFQLTPNFDNSMSSNSTVSTLQNNLYQAYVMLSPAEYIFFTESQAILSYIFLKGGKIPSLKSTFSISNNPIQQQTLLCILVGTYQKQRSQ